MPMTLAATDNKLTARFRQWADALEAKIEHASRPLTQNPTPKRNREYQSRLHDARDLEGLQKALRALADLHESGEISDELAALKTKGEIGGMVRKSTTGGGGYYSVIECDDYYNTSPVARHLQSLIDGSSYPQVIHNASKKLRYASRFILTLKCEKRIILSEGRMADETSYSQ